MQKAKRRLNKGLNFETQTRNLGSCGCRISRRDVASVIPPSVRAHATVWCVNAPIINFQMVEWYVGDWVLHQFGRRQHIPDIPIQLGKDVYRIDKKGKHAKNLALEHQPYIVMECLVGEIALFGIMSSRFHSSRDYQ
ncbi:hypothetical protein PVK06_030353 [Gossypium arboreum]|uniref:Uncharacterized protein n=1 Tax=Gossypium arboreum TaxID=29729 RepID=A0ABR0NN27_GOSAR|nr:hypothetical protein PVK06_030353 [Gossypium arboreum]